MRRGALPGRKPGIRVSRAILRKAASMALSNSTSSTSTDTLTLLPSRDSTLDRIGGPPYRGVPPTSPTQDDGENTAPSIRLSRGVDGNRGGPRHHDRQDPCQRMTTESRSPRGW